LRTQLEDVTKNGDEILELLISPVDGGFSRLHRTELLLVCFRREARLAAEPVRIRCLPPATNQIITIPTAASADFENETALLNQKRH
jgi:hypothetical protein